jgi:hypothetical protein
MQNLGSFTRMCSGGVTVAAGVLCPDGSEPVTRGATYFKDVVGVNTPCSFQSSQSGAATSKNNDTRDYFALVEAASGLQYLQTLFSATDMNPDPSLNPRNTGANVVGVNLFVLGSANVTISVCDGSFRPTAVTTTKCLGAASNDPGNGPHDQ